MIENLDETDPELAAALKPLQLAILFVPPTEVAPTGEVLVLKVRVQSPSRWVGGWAQVPRASLQGEQAAALAGCAGPVSPLLVEVDTRDETGRGFCFFGTFVPVREPDPRSHEELELAFLSLLLRLQLIGELL